MTSAPLALPGVEHFYSGKVRDLYARPDGHLLLVASDRISAYDFVLPTPIPDKGRILTALTLWWFDRLAGLVPNHLVSLDVPAEVAGRAMVVERLEMFPVECVARGYLAGSGLLDYQATGVGLRGGAAAGTRRRLAAAGRRSSLRRRRLSWASTTRTSTSRPSSRRSGRPLRRSCASLTVEMYVEAEAIARERGILLADTKLEFGRRTDGTVVLGDEVLTPDSSRFWPADGWEPGHPQPSYDKQFVRDWLTSPESGWDRHSGEAPPPLPDDVVERTRARYVEAYERLTGRTFA